MCSSFPKVAGVTFGSRQAALKRIGERYSPDDVAVTLRYEPDNQYDRNAVAVDVSVNGSKAYRLGYLPREWAEFVAGIMDAGVALTARLRGITGGYGEKLNCGALVEIQL